MSRVRVASEMRPWPTGPTGLPRLLRERREEAVSFAAHLDTYGPSGVAGSRDLLAAIGEAGVRGRGGAGFPTVTKMQAVARGRGPKVIVANGCEGEPASAKDRTLMRESPHLVLDGIAMAANAVGAEKAFVAVERTRPASAEALAAAIDDRARFGEDPLPIQVVSVPGRYVAGEESALVHWINGGDAKPTTVPPRPFERGVGGRPTLVQNVETLAHVALIGRFGPEWFRTLGSDDEPGSALVTAAGAVARPGVCEIAIGTRVGDLFDAAGGPESELGAVLVGGYFGTWVPIADALDVQLSNAALRSVGASLGCGVVAALPLSACPLAETARVLRYLAEETAGQCGPCVFGLASVAEDMSALARGDAGRTIVEDLQRRSRVISRRGACHHPDGAIRFLRSALGAFPEEIGLHQHGRCRATSAKPILPIPHGPARELAWR